MTLFWEGTPTVAGGMVASATAHLDAWAKATGLLHDRLVGFQMPFTGWDRYSWESGSPLVVETTPEWIFRHKFNTLRYVVEHGGGTCSLYLPDHANFQLVTFATNGTFSGTIDLTARGLPYNGFYRIAAGWPSDGWLRVWLLAELDTVTTFPTLASFADGTTPTTYDWQNLSDYAEKLHTVTAVPVPPMAGHAAWGSRPYAWNGTFVYGGGDVIWKLRTQANYDRPTFRHNAKVYINGTLAVTHTNEGASVRECEFTGTLDPATYGVSVGDEYKVHIETDTVSDSSIFGRNFVIEYVYEVPTGDATVYGYTSMPNFAHGDYVNGSTGAKPVKSIRDNLIAIKAAAKGYNMGVPRHRQYQIWNAWGADASKDIKITFGYYKMVRRHRFLHYLGFPPDFGKEPKQIEIKWSLGEWEDKEWKEEMGGYASYPIEQTFTADASSSEWRTINLDELDGLWPGVPYQIKDAYYCIEDNDA